MKHGMENEIAAEQVCCAAVEDVDPKAPRGGDRATELSRCALIRNIDPKAQQMRWTAMEEISVWSVILAIKC